MDPLKSAELMNSPNRFLSWLFFGTKLIGAIVVVALGALYYNQEKLLYFPTPPGFPVTPDDNPPGFRSPGEYTKDGQYQKKKGRPEDSITFEDVMVKTEDGELIHTWLLLRDDNEVHHHPTLIYFHGNAGNMGFRLQNAVSMFRKSKLNILMMDYRGFGKSTGHPTENGIKADGDAVLKYAAAHPK
jgi:pimeloyl-ACP methyl ester carboxylesterase